MVIVMLAVLLLGVFVLKKRCRSNAKQIAFSAMAIALAMVTSLIKIFEMPLEDSLHFFPCCS